VAVQTSGLQAAILIAPTRYRSSTLGDELMPTTATLNPTFEVLLRGTASTESKQLSATETRVRETLPARDAHDDRSVLDARPWLESVPNELLFREVNEHSYRRPGWLDGKHREIEVICECGRRGCLQFLRITAERYEAIRAFPTRFVMEPDHPLAADERIVESDEAFVVVEKTGRAARVAVHADPRKQRHTAPAR
jgi:hypothetical protein